MRRVVVWQSLCFVLVLCLLQSELQKEIKCRPLHRRLASSSRAAEAQSLESDDVAPPKPQSVTQGTCSLNNKPSIFSKTEIQTARETRANWTKALPFQIENMLTQNMATGSNEREYPVSHARFEMLGPMTPKCHELEHFGSGDGEKRACSLSRFVRESQDECTIISLGSNNEWDFEIAIYNAFPSCRIETFDCTVPQHIRAPASIASRTTLHHVCVGPENLVDPLYKSWKTILKMLGVKTAPLYLKMDIEGHEYQVLRSIVDDGTLLPIQIAFELHYMTQSEHLPWAVNHNRKSSAEILTFMEYLQYQGGYYFIDRRDNMACPFCTELLITQLPCLD